MSKRDGTDGLGKARKNKGHGMAGWVNETAGQGRERQGRVTETVE